jgi:hypothetical protein
MMCRSLLSQARLVYKPLLVPHSFPSICLSTLLFKTLCSKVWGIRPMFALLALLKIKKWLLSLLPKVFQERSMSALARSLSQNSLLSVFCSKTSRNGKMSAPPGSAQKQLLYLISKMQESPSHVFSVRLCANIRLSSLLFKKAFDFFICLRCRSLLKYTHQRTMSVLSVSLWINIISYEIQADQNKAYVCSFVSAQYRKSHVSVIFYGLPATSSISVLFNSKKSRDLIYVCAVGLFLKLQGRNVMAASSASLQINISRLSVQNDSDSFHVCLPASAQNPVLKKRTENDSCPQFSVSIQYSPQFLGNMNAKDRCLLCPASVSKARILGRCLSCRFCTPQISRLFCSCLWRPPLLKYSYLWLQYCDDSIYSLLLPVSKDDQPIECLSRRFCTQYIFHLFCSNDGF